MARVPKPLGILALGDLAAYVEFSPKLDLEVNDFVQRFALVVQEQGMPWLRDVVPALGGLALHFDAGFDGDVIEAATLLVDVCLKKGVPGGDELGRRVEVPVCYEGELAPDMAEIAARSKLPAEEVVKRHAAAEYRVLMIGFAPGHAYMGGLDAKLAVPRRATPRPEVPAGSVAIANDQTVVYPYAIAGGWNVIGRTPLVVFDAFRARPSLFMTGDRVRFVPITRAQFMSFAK
jgi:inhibitor of KinA